MMNIPKRLDPQFFKDGDGQFSMMRLMTYRGSQMANVIIVAGLVITPLELFLFKTGTNVGFSLVAAGVAMYSAGEGAKAWQAKSENQGSGT
jgi:hypothetical protein